MRNLAWRFLRWILFRINPESAHRVVMLAIRAGVFLRGVPLRFASGSGTVFGGVARGWGGRPIAPCPIVFGMEFLSRVGLAAGFDKDAEIARGLADLGFGFVEIGTVTPRPQDGNPRPRLFRVEDTASLFNCMGFNGLGAQVVSRRLASIKGLLPANFRLGVNLGKNRDTPIENAAVDYAEAARFFEGLADYLVINVSSPNTPGLRFLQSPQAIKPIIGEVSSVISSWGRRPPLLLKVSPELKGLELAELIQVAEASGIDGWVLTNTLAADFKLGGASLSGGYSGGVLSEQSRKSLFEARHITKLPIISVGGIMNKEEAIARRAAGADLVQVFTGWIYRGPGFPVEITRVL